MSQNTNSEIENTPTQRAAVVTGASSGIGAATVAALADKGWKVFAFARREDKLTSVAEAAGAVAVVGDVTVQEDIDRLLKIVTEQGGVDTVINIAGGALGVDTIGNAKDEDWERMYAINVLGTMKVTRAFLPMLRENGEGTVLNMTSMAALVSYEGGGGYNAAKSAERAMTHALRLEEAENNVRVIEVLPGMVYTEEFSLVRLGSKEAAEKVYQGVEKPLLAEDIADIVSYAVNAPHHVNLDEIVVRPVAQAAVHKVIRKN
ncbi:SDR family oxidoreductase [Neomicrococcus aestuarii]|uniref:Oxidoreductase n=1 Tax=Neomicrococcus aestuarii TaxID=556325 RepID=A0A1L2ZLV7_9MICC|nr:SDR family oxidoreductase [Neomicrococcus aestuarii]APF40001.1 oxidoreductase [Neomicrococcus aestuarii]